MILLLGDGKPEERLRLYKYLKPRELRQMLARFRSSSLEMLDLVA